MQILCWIAYCNAMACQAKQTQNAGTRLPQLHPALRVSNLETVLGLYRRAEDVSRGIAGMTMAATALSDGCDFRFWPIVLKKSAVATQRYQ
jgi:hypothetical protein